MSTRFIDLNRRRAIIAYKIVEQLIDEVEKFEKMPQDQKENTEQIVEQKEEFEEKVKQAKENKKQEMRTLCRNLPVYIQQNSLVTTIIYLHKSKLDDENGTREKTVKQYLFEEIIEWLKEYTGNEDQSNEDFFTKNVCGCNMRQYRALTTEAIAFTSWLKNSVESLIE